AEVNQGVEVERDNGDRHRGILASGGSLVRVWVAMARWARARPLVLALSRPPVGARVLALARWHSPPGALPIHVKRTLGVRWPGKSRIQDSFVRSRPAHCPRRTFTAGEIRGREGTADTKRRYTTAERSSHVRYSGWRPPAPIQVWPPPAAIQGWRVARAARRRAWRVGGSQSRAPAPRHRRQTGATDPLIATC